MPEANSPKTYACSCRKCGANFISTNENDTDGDALCPECKEKADVIAKNVQKIIEQRRMNRPPVPPRMEPVKVPGTDYIDSRFLR